MKANRALAAFYLAISFVAATTASRAGTCTCRDGDAKGSPSNSNACCCQEMAPSAFTKNSIYQLDARFRDDSGKEFALGTLRGRPVVLDMFFTSCGFACPLTVTDMLAIQGRLPADVRRRAVFVLVSFDSARDTSEALARYRAQRQLDGQWVLLRGDDDAVRELAALLGVSYRREADGSFTHSNILTVLNPQGELAFRRTGLSGGLSELGAAVTAAIK